jgi:hypothetical protein
VNGTQRILIVYDDGDARSQWMAPNARQALRDARLACDEVDLSRDRLPELASYSCVLLCAEVPKHLQSRDVERLRDWVESGGGLVAACRTWHPAILELAGLPASEDAPRCLEGTAAAEGLRFISAELPAFHGLEASTSEIGDNLPWDVTPDDAATILATTSAGHPLAWMFEYGEGRVVYWNSAILAHKRGRGLIVQSIAVAQQVSVLPLANVAVIQIDDFPAPLGPADLGHVADEYPGLTATEFYTRIWHPDMLALAERQGIEFTYLATFNYNDRVTPPFDFGEWEHHRVRIGGELVSATAHSAAVAAQNGELGFHGYNHCSLTADTWSSTEAMKQALRAVAERWQTDGLGNLPAVYVPPSNEYDEAGLEALAAELPSIEIVSGLFYDGSPERGGQRELGPEPWNPKLFALPRATSGYGHTPEVEFDALSQIATAGIWTHFVHPDDVFDVPRGAEYDVWCRNPAGRRWRTHGTGEGSGQGLMDVFEGWVEAIRSRFPWLRFVGTQRGASIVRGHLEGSWDVRWAGDRIELDLPTGSCFQLRLNGGRALPARLPPGARYLHVQREEGFSLYTIESEVARLTLELRPRRETFLARLFGRGPD